MRRDFESVPVYQDRKHTFNWENTQLARAQSFTEESWVFFFLVHCILATGQRSLTKLLQLKMAFNVCAKPLLLCSLHGLFSILSPCCNPARMCGFWSLHSCFPWKLLKQHEMLFKWHSTLCSRSYFSSSLLMSWGCWGLERDIMSGCEGEEKKNLKSSSDAALGQSEQGTFSENEKEMKRSAAIDAICTLRNLETDLSSKNRQRHAVKAGREVGGGAVAVLPTKKRHYQKPTRQQMFPAAFALQV